MLVRECDNCRGNLEALYSIYDEKRDLPFHVCSLECLQEWAWSQREKEKKLSKSNILSVEKGYSRE